MEIPSLLNEIFTWLASLGVIPMLLGGWLLASLGCPVLILFTAFSLLAGIEGLFIAFISLYLATLTIYLVATRVSTRFNGHDAVRDTVKGTASPWLFVSASLIPFLPFVALSAARGVSLARVYLAIFAVSTPTLLIFSLATLLGSRVGLSPLWVGLAAAGAAVLFTRLQRGWMGKGHEHLPAASGIQRGKSPR
jgi:hypothetical protein